MSDHQVSARFRARVWARPIAAARHWLDASLHWLQTVLQRARGLGPRLSLRNLPVVGAKLRPPTAPVAGALTGVEPSSPFEVREHVFQLLKPGITELGNALRNRRGSTAAPQTLSETKLAGTPSGGKPEPKLETKG